MTLLTLSFSKLAISLLILSSISDLVNGQVRRRHGPRHRLLEQVVWDPQEHVVVDEPLFFEEVSPSFLPMMPTCRRVVVL